MMGGETGHFHDDPTTLVSTEWLHKHLNDPDIRILDGSWHMPDSGRDGAAEYQAAHIPCARFFDVDEVADTDNPLPHMVPSAEKFVSRMRKLGIGDGHQIVVYDSHGIFSAARVWWMFRLMGCERVAVLDGGLPKWQGEGRAIEDLPPMVRDRHLTARYDNHLIASLSATEIASHSEQRQIVDSRGRDRFEGAVLEPREGLRSGHIPASRNIPYSELLDEQGCLLGNSALRAAFDAAAVDVARPFIATCGSGVTAAIIALAAARLGNRDVAVYDGSWSEWGQLEHLPIETGPAR